MISDVILTPLRLQQIVTVGGSAADVCGFDSKAIQLAMDALKVRGGGIIELKEGTFEISAPIRIYNNITLTGMGRNTVLHKVAGFKTDFVIDADYGELMLTVAAADGFKTGMGIRVCEQESNGWEVSTPVITAIKGNIVYIDRYLGKDYQADKGGTISNACSIIEVIGAENVKISNLTIEGGKETNEYINGCVGGGIYLHKSKNCLVENVKVANFSGDGISWQITEDITVRDCEVSGCTNFGIHPGTGSKRTVVEGCDVHHNASDGLFVCWRVQAGEFKGNKFHNNGFNGINIGHKDTDNHFESNHIYENANSGVYLRPETDINGAHRNFFKRNLIENNGNPKSGSGFLIDSYVEDNILEGNIIRDTGSELQKTGILIKRKAVNLVLENNIMSGHLAGDIEDISGVHS